MELAMNSQYGSLLSAYAPMVPTDNGCNAVEFTKNLADSILADKIVPLNQQVAALSYVDGYTNQCDVYSNTHAQFNGVNTEQVHQFLKGIPIYNEVLTYQVKDRMNIGPGTSNQKLSMDILHCTQMSSLKLGSDLIDRMSRKRQADFFGNETSAAGMNMNSEHKNSQIHSDNSSTFSAELMNRMQSKSTSTGPKGADKGAHSPSKESLELNNTYTGQTPAGTYKAVIVLKGQNVAIPYGYIKVDAEKIASRKTKVVTACEHTDRKHYAKGFCSTCYHKGGRTKLAWNCEHGDRLHYAKGCCQECYLQFHSKRGKKFNKRKALKRKQDEELNELLKLDGNDTFDDLCF